MRIVSIESILDKLLTEPQDFCSIVLFVSLYSHIFVIALSGVVGYCYTQHCVFCTGLDTSSG